MNMYTYKHIPRYTLLSSKNVSRETRIARGKKSNNKHKEYSTAVGIQHVADACLLIFRFFIAQKKNELKLLTSDSWQKIGMKKFLLLPLDNVKARVRKNDE